MTAPNPPDDGPAESPIPALRREALLHEGMHDAFLFALEHDGDRNALIEAITATRTAITTPSPSLAPAMEPGASPRLYRDGYLAGLQKALEIVDPTPPR